MYVLCCTLCNNCTTASLHTQVPPRQHCIALTPLLIINQHRWGGATVSLFKVLTRPPSYESGMGSAAVATASASLVYNTLRTILVAAPP